MVEKYDADSIKVLEEIEHIQHNPGMYIGDTDKATHLLTEAFDNAIDEAKAGFAKLVAVVIDTKKKEYNVLDNGRGIPIKKGTVEIVASKLFSGGKFNKGKGKVYGIATGRHGVGIVAITALSEYMEIDVYREKLHAMYRWEKAKLEKDDIVDFKTGKAPYATKITFKPKKKYFESIDVNIDYIRKRMKIASVHIPSLTLALVIDGRKETITCNLNEYFKEDILSKETKNITKIFDLKVKVDDEELLVRWCYSFNGSVTPRQHGCINLLSVDYGNHIQSTYDMFRDVMMEFGKKEKMTFNKQDATVGLRVFTSLMLYDPAYSSQSKERFSTPKQNIEYLYKDAQKQLSDLLTKNSELRNTLLSFFETYRKKLDSSKSIIKSGSTVTRTNSVIGSKLRDCTTHSVKDSELYIVEGESAGGTLVQCRDPHHHAILGLKGKILNVAADGKDPLKNNEVIDIVNACGTGVEPDFHIDKIRYGKIIIATDADADGSHISTLLMVLFLKLMPEIIEKGYLYLANVPLYGAIPKKGGFIPLFTEELLEKYKEQNPKDEITRFKGLGEMDPPQLEKCLIDVKSRKLTPVIYPTGGVKDIMQLMVDANLKRKLV